MRSTSPNQVLLHGVQDDLGVGSGEVWGDQLRRCTIVAIGHDLNQALWQRALEDCRATIATTT